MTVDLAKALKDFFYVYLAEQRGLSPHTLKSYRDTFRLLFLYLQAQRRNGGVRLLDLDVKTILAFLQHLEDAAAGRGNSARTRNLRLTAIQGFFKYLSLMYPSLERHAQRVLAIPLKRVPPRLVQSLERRELEALLLQPRSDSSDGVRDLAVLTFLYNTGARASEAANARLSWFDFAGRFVTILGKGQKKRVTPLWPSTVRLLKFYIERHRRTPKVPGDFFFVDQRGLPFTRFGIRTLVKRYLKAAAKRCPSLATKRLSTHSLRHTTAVHLLESGVDPTVIKDWLGHATLDSTTQYLDTHLRRKRRILQQFGPPASVVQVLQPPEPSKIDLLEWLNDL